MNLHQISRVHKFTNTKNCRQRTLFATAKEKEKKKKKKMVMHIIAR